MGGKKATTIGFDNCDCFVGVFLLLLLLLPLLLLWGD